MSERGKRFLAEPEKYAAAGVRARLRRRFGCWHAWVCRMGISGCSCGPHHCSRCGVLWEDRDG